MPEVSTGLAMPNFTFPGLEKFSCPGQRTIF